MAQVRAAASTFRLLLCYHFAWTLNRCLHHFSCDTSLPAETVARLAEPTKTSSSYHLDSQWSAKQHWAGKPLSFPLHQDYRAEAGWRLGRHSWQKICVQTVSKSHFAESTAEASLRASCICHASSLLAKDREGWHPWKGPAPPPARADRFQRQLKSRLLMEAWGDKPWECPAATGYLREQEMQLFVELCSFPLAICLWTCHSRWFLPVQRIFGAGTSN